MAPFNETQLLLYFYMKTFKNASFLLYLNDLFFDTHIYKKIVVHFEKKWETGDVKIAWPGHLSHFSSNVSIKSLYIMIVAWGLSQ